MFSVLGERGITSLNAESEIIVQIVFIILVKIIIILELVVQEQKKE